MEDRHYSEGDTFDSVSGSKLFYKADHLWPEGFDIHTCGGRHGFPPPRFRQFPSAAGGLFRDGNGPANCIKCHSGMK